MCACVGRTCRATCKARSVAHTRDKSGGFTYDVVPSNGEVSENETVKTVGNSVGLELDLRKEGHCPTYVTNYGIYDLYYCTQLISTRNRWQ